MDRSWMTLRHRWCKQYVDGVKEFIEFAKDHMGQDDMVRCPCLKCMNAYYKHLNEVEDDLYINGIQGTYTRWIFHGENLSFHDTYPAVNSINSDAWGNDGMISSEEDEDNEILNMLNDIQGGTFTNIRDTNGTGSRQPLEREREKFNRVLREAQRDLYPGCKICDTVLGTRSGYVCGLGHGPKPVGSSSRSRVLEFSNRELREELASQREKIQQMEARHEEFASQREKIQTMEARQQELEDLVRRLLSSSAPSAP